MSTITYKTCDGTEYQVEYTSDDSVMSTAVNHDIPGIEGECGGQLNCGTCHVYVEAPWQDAFPEAAFDEEDMLEVVEDRRPESRLSCQLRLTPEHRGVTVTVAAEG